MNTTLKRGRKSTASPGRIAVFEAAKMLEVDEVINVPSFSVIDRSWLTVTLRRTFNKQRSFQTMGMPDGTVKIIRTL